MSVKKPKPNPPAKQKLPGKNKRNRMIILFVLAVVSAIMLGPALYYGNFTIQIARLVFDETSSTMQPVLTSPGGSPHVEGRSVYDYAYSIETGGIFRTTDRLVSVSQGTVSISIHITLLTPSGKTVMLESPTITGGIGERSHTIFLGPNEGVRDPGLYQATITLAATVLPTSGSFQSGSTTLQPIFFVVASS